MREFKTFLLIPLCAGIGIVMAMIVELMDTKGWIVDEYITGTITLADVQIVIVIFFILTGILLGVLSKK